MDWSATPVGPVETWPQSLRTVLSILLTSRHPIFVWWGQELVQFYNDGYRPILGATKHPRALGQRGRECWTEIWDVIGSMIQSVMERGESTFIQDGLLCLDRNGYLEEAYFTYAYSPIQDESGGTGGVFVACTESTERILSERRLQTLRELSAATSEVKSEEEVCRKAAGVLTLNPHDVPFALLYLTDARGQTPRLVGTVGLEPGSAAAPLLLDAGPWPWESIERTGEALQVDCLPCSLGPLPGGPWPEAASSALVLPLFTPGHDTPTGMLVAGLSPRKALDAKYRGFLELTATQLSNALTHVRAYEQEKRRAELLAALDRARLHSQLMQAPVAVAILTGPHLVFELANPRYLEMVGRRDGRVVGRPVRAVFPELPRDAPVFQVLEEVYAIGRAFTADAYRIPLDRRGNGELEDVYFQLTCQPMRDVRGSIVGVMVVAADVTTQVVARTQAEEADRRKDEFLAMLAHELRNPLAALSTALEVMKHARSDEAKGARLRDICAHQVTSLVRMVDDLLDVSRITRGKVELRKQEVDLLAIIQNAIETSRPHINGRGHELSVTLAPGDFRLEADATRLEQVVSNLLSNAARYTEPGGAISVRLGREESGGQPWAVLRVRDTGRGIARDMQDKVFELFFQVDPSIDRTSGGLGIGLTLVKRLVGMHGGTVHAYSEGPGQGSEFTVRLPLPRQLPRATQTPRPSTLHVPLFHPKRRVLVVEDRAAVRETLRVLLENMGHEVAVATNGLEGVTQALKLLPDVALVDVGLPGIDGYELARRVRASREGASLFLVALTGYGGTEAQAKALQAGFDLHLVKPLHESDLLRVLESAGQRGASELHCLP
jgi:signal transduction histidine kinase/ActR/RegA family two-component response regulator